MAAKSEARIAKRNAGSRDAKVSTARWSLWTVSATMVESPMRRSGREQRNARRRRQWVTRTSNLVQVDFRREKRMKLGEYLRNYASNFGGKKDQPVPNSSAPQQCVGKEDLSGDDGILRVVKISAPNRDVFIFCS